MSRLYILSLVEILKLSTTCMTGNSGRYDEALEYFIKLHSILKNSAHVIYHLSDLYDKLDDLSI